MNADDANEIAIRPATQSDLPAILALIHALAEYENLSHAVVATEDLLHRWLFGSDRAAEVLIAWSGTGPIGFALFFRSFSTFLGRPGIHLEDLFVEPQWRGRGVGRALLTRVARIAVERGCGRLEWAVLNWNAPALRFYERLGAEPLDEWTAYRLTGDALARLGGPAARG